MSAFTHALEIAQNKRVYRASEMPYQYWIWFKWEMIQEFGEIEPKYLFNGIRPIEEALIAKQQIDTWLQSQ